MSQNEDNAVAGPSSKNEDNAVAGPSNKSDIASNSVTSKKSVRFNEDLTQRGKRKQSLIGTAGYVTQLLGQYMKDVPEKKDEEKPIPIRKRPVEERRASVQAIEKDVEYYMQGILGSQSRKSIAAKSSRSKSIAAKSSRSKSIAAERSRSKSIAAESSRSDYTIPNITARERMEEVRTFSDMMKNESRHNSKWSPSQIFLQEADEEHAVSWVGAYVVGKDYWAEEKEGSSEEKDQKVSYSMDEKTQSWYNMPLKQPVKDSVFQKMKNLSLEKIENLKGEFKPNYEDIRKERLISAERARQEAKATDEWDEEFKIYFWDVCKSGDLSKLRISMTELDKWLERARILDYTHLNLVQTGLYFIASGGSRHRGITFDEFAQFLHMISHTMGMQIKEIVMRLKACQRKPECLQSGKNK